MWGMENGTLKRLEKLWLKNISNTEFSELFLENCTELTLLSTGETALKSVRT